MNNPMPKQLTANVGNVNGGGRPKGSRNRTTIIKECLHGKMANIAQEDLDMILDEVVKMAKGGSLRAARLIMESAYRIIEAEQQTGGQGITINVNRGGVTLKSGDDTLSIENTDPKLIES